MSFTAIIEREGSLYVAKAAELEIASQGRSVEEAIKNLKEAIGLYLKHAEPAELYALRRLAKEGCPAEELFNY
jgi:predicted RNase H-like HicB family nuclease